MAQLPVTFTRSVPGTRDEGTDTNGPPVITTITGHYIIKTTGDPTRWAALKLNPSSAPQLLFTPTGYPRLAYTDDFVKPGDLCTINGKVMIVRDVQPICPDGTVVSSYIIVEVG